MNKFLSFFILVFFVSLQLCGQKIIYSKVTFPIGSVVYQVSNLNGYYHVVSLDPDQNLLFYIFDGQLQLVAKKKLELSYSQDCDVRIMEFPGYYYLYTHEKHSYRHNLWRIDQQGTMESLSVPLQGIVDSFCHSNETLELVRQPNSIYFASFTYFNQLKFSRCVAVQVDQNIHWLSNDTAWYRDDVRKDQVCGVALDQGYLYVLKKWYDEEKGNFLGLSKIDLHSKKTIVTNFSSGDYEYDNAHLNLNRHDSSVLVSAIVKEPYYRIKMERKIFLANVNKDLQTRDSIVLKSPFRKGVGTNFLLVNGRWLAERTVWTRTGASGSIVFNPDGGDGLLYLPLRNQRPDLTGIRLTSMNNQLKMQADSLIKNRGFIELQSDLFAQARLQNKDYLILVRRFYSKRQMLTMVSVDKNGRFVSSDIPVFDKYDYELGNLKTDNGDCLIIPYTTKSEMGLMKVSFKNLE